MTVSALGELAGQAGAALPTGRNCADQNSVADFVTGHAVTELFYYANRFVSDNQTRAHRVFAAQDMEIGPANGRQGHSNNGFACSGVRARHIFDSDVFGAVENRCLHRARNPYGLVPVVLLLGR
jgi:hypothetical protein